MVELIHIPVTHGAAKGLAKPSDGSLLGRSIVFKLIVYKLGYIMQCVVNGCAFDGSAVG